MIIGIAGKIGSGKSTLGRMTQAIALNAIDPVNYARTHIHTYSTIGNWGIKKFAGKLKEFCASILNVSRDAFEDEEFKNSVLGPEWNRFTAKTIYGESIGEDKVLTVREFMQRIGEGIRKEVHPDFWVNALFVDYKLEFSKKFHRNELLFDENFELPPEKYPDWIIDDVRYPNEAQSIKDRGGIVVHVDRSYTFGKGNKKVEKLKIIDASAHISETALDSWQFDYIANNEGTLEELLVDAKYILHVILKGKC